MAMQKSDIPRRKHEIAESEGISSDYVEQILIRLKAAGLVESHRGAKGGFTISGSPEEITVADVLQASEGPMAIVPCSKSDCNRETACVTREIWQQAENALAEVFEKQTVAGLAEKAQRMRSSILYDI
jgi:Rrf2 family protein